MKKIHTLGLGGLLLLGGSTVAWAQDIGSMEDLFPAMPCHDGWAACLVDGDEISPDAVRDSAGRPLPSDMRVGWFDLSPTAAFDPFHGLSDYTGELPGSGDGAVDALLDGEGPPEEVEEEDTAEDFVEVEGPSEEEIAAQRAEAERLAAEQAAASAEAQRFEQERREAERRAAEAAAAQASAKDDAAREAARREAERLEQERQAAERRAAEAAAKEAAARREAERQAAEAAQKEAERRAAEEAAAKEAERLAAEAAAKDAADREGEGDGVAMVDNDTTKKDPAGGATAECSNLVQLEPAALMGKLSAGQTACLEKTLVGTATQTGKDKISRVLLSNAEASGNKKEWERLMRRHLEEIDRSDPNLCFKYALHLSRGGVGRAWGTIKWADYALENKTQWSGTTYKTRVYSLYQLKAEASMKLWQDANNKLVEAGGDNRDELAANEEKLRGMAKDYAREWLDYARASGQDTKKPMSLCVSAAGSKKYCEDG